MNRVVVTGIGLVTPIGSEASTFERNMFEGRSGARAIRGSYVAENFPVPYAALVDTKAVQVAGVLKAMKPAELSRFWLFAASATEQAIEGLDRGMGVDGIVYGTAEGVSFEIVSESLKLLREQGSLVGFDWRNARTESSLDILNEMLCDRGAPTLPPERLIAINSACASGNQAIGVGFQHLRAGRWTRCLVGGVDARCNPSSLMNFHQLSAVTVDDVPPHKASRPFAKDRSGFVRGEGAATLLLETLDSALARSAKIYGEIGGCANTSDAYRLTDGREDGASVVRAMRGAIADAGLAPEDVDYINAHGTSTPLNDRLETQSIKTVFGERAYKIPVSSLKSQIGHPTVAAGAIETVACLLMIARQKLAPTLNLDQPDPECDLDYVPHQARDARVSVALNNSFGFGGQNSCVIVKEFRA